MKAAETRSEYCQRKAAEARTRAATVFDQDGRRVMLEVRPCGMRWPKLQDVTPIPNDQTAVEMKSDLSEHAAPRLRPSLSTFPRRVASSCEPHHLS